MTPASRRTWRVRTALQVAGAGLYAALAIAIVWGGEPGSFLAQLTGPRTDDGPWSYAAAVALMVGGVSLLDAEVAPVASVALTAVMLGALAVVPHLQGPTLVVSTLLAVAAVIAWVTRDDRRALCADGATVDEDA